MVLPDSPVKDFLVNKLNDHQCIQMDLTRIIGIGGEALVLQHQTNINFATKAFKLIPRTKYNMKQSNSAIRCNFALRFVFVCCALFAVYRIVWNMFIIKTACHSELVSLKSDTYSTNSSEHGFFQQFSASCISEFQQASLRMFCWVIFVLFRSIFFSINITNFHLLLREFCCCNCGLIRRFREGGSSVRYNLNLAHSNYCVFACCIRRAESPVYCMINCILNWINLIGLFVGLSIGIYLQKLLANNPISGYDERINNGRNITTYMYTDMPVEVTRLFPSYIFCICFIILWQVLLFIIGCIYGIQRRRRYQASLENGTFANVKPTKCLPSHSIGYNVNPAYLQLLSTLSEHEYCSIKHQNVIEYESVTVDVVSGVQMIIAGK